MIYGIGLLVLLKRSADVKDVLGCSGLVCRFSDWLPAFTPGRGALLGTLLTYIQEVVWFIGGRLKCRELEEVEPMAEDIAPLLRAGLILGARSHPSTALRSLYAAPALPCFHSQPPLTAEAFDILKTSGILLISAPSYSRTSSYIPSILENNL